MYVISYHTRYCYIMLHHGISCHITYYNMRQPRTSLRSARRPPVIIFDKCRFDVLYIYIYIYTHIHIYIYIYTYTHTKYTQNWACSLIFGAPGGSPPRSPPPGPRPGRAPRRAPPLAFMCVYIYIYIYNYLFIYLFIFIHLYVLIDLFIYLFICMMSICIWYILYLIWYNSVGHHLSFVVYVLDWYV